MGAEMNILRRRNLLSRVDGKVVRVSLFFVAFALFSTLLKADMIKNVEQLEFRRVLLHGDNEVQIAQGDETTLKIFGDDDKLSPVPFKVKGDTLHLGVTANNREVRGIKFKLVAPVLEAIEVNGSGEAYVKPLQLGDLVVAVEGSGDIKMFDVIAEDLELRVSGSGTVQAVNITAREVRLNLKGSGDIQLGSLKADGVRSVVQGSGDIAMKEDGHVGNLEIQLMGSGDIGLGKLRATDANVTIMGSGDVEIGVEENLEAEIMGSGDLKYWGSPRTSTSVLGSGEIRQRD
jgi:hypothetical protein